MLKATKKQLEQWKLERRPENEWVPEDCRLIILATNEVMFFIIFLSFIVLLQTSLTHG